MSDCKEWIGRHWLTGKRISVRAAAGKIVSITAVQDQSPDAKGDWIAPGLIDLQVNGIHAVDFNDPTTTVEQIGEAVRYLHSIGVVRFCPT
ncbi:MAG: nagA, partial [Paenibacillus sp.]|nr:nagA [Paenibacillus sp.]